MKKLFGFLLLLIGIILFYLNYQEKLSFQDQQAEKSKNKNVIPSTLTKMPEEKKRYEPSSLKYQDIPDSCARKINEIGLTEKFLAPNGIPSIPVFTNWHLQNKDGTIYRVRIFREDGNNRTFRKLVLYKEDESGFPQLIKIPVEDERDPSQKTIDKYLSKGSIIYTQEGFESNDLENADIYWEKVDGKLVRLDISTPNKNIDCRVD